MQDTNRLIEKLKKDSRVSTVVGMRSSLLLYVFLSLAYVIIIEVVSPEWSIHRLTLAELIFGIFAVGMTGRVALSSAVPGETKLAMTLSAVLSVVLWIVIDGMGEIDLVGNYSLSGGYECMESVVGFMLLPAFMLGTLVWRGAPLRSGFSAFFVVVSSGMVANMAMKLCCRSESALHLLLYHILPCAVIAAGVTWLAGNFFSWKNRVDRYKKKIAI